MKFILAILLFCFSFSIYSQKEVKMAGDTTNEKFMESVRKLEAQGWNVQIVTPEELANKSPERDLFREMHVGNPLPEFSFETIDGERISSLDLRNKLVHLNFWSVTCKPCVEEFPELNDLKEKYRSENTVFLAIAPETEERVRNVLNKHPLDYHVIAGAEEYFEQLGIDGYPVNFFVNSDGTIYEVLEGSTYRGVKRNGEMKMIPDNFKNYDRLMSELN